MTFGPQDLAQLETLLLGRARAVISLREVHAGNTQPNTIALRHDVDDNRDSFQTAQNMARWEAARGYRSTYFILHGASYWTDQPFFRAGLEEIALAGHEIGIHVNAIATALRYGCDPHEYLASSLDELREWGHTITGAASHGDTLCYDAAFVNYDQFTDCQRDLEPRRTLTWHNRSLTLEPVPLADFGLRYEAYHLPRQKYLSDSGGVWSHKFEDYALQHDFAVQLHILQHPDWWGAALSPEKVAA